MCNAFLKFYPDPISATCKLVEPEFMKECPLRVKLNDHLEKKEYNEARKVRKLLEGVEDPE